MVRKRGQISLEYLILVGFITFVIIGTMAIAFIYSGSIKDQVRVSQVSNYGKKIISTSEKIYYQGEPSKSTISVYLPENVQNITFYQNILFITVQTSSGTEKISFSSDVPVDGNLSSGMGIKKIEIRAEEDKVIITQL